MSKLSDGVEFKSGMTIYFPNYIDYKIEEVKTPDYNIIKNEGDYLTLHTYKTIYIPHHYSTREGAKEKLVKYIERHIQRLQTTIKVLYNNE